jgi:hypothetical protein
MNAAIAAFPIRRDSATSELSRLFGLSLRQSGSVWWLCLFSVLLAAVCCAV